MAWEHVRADDVEALSLGECSGSHYGVSRCVSVVGLRCCCGGIAMRLDDVEALSLGEWT